MSAAKHAMGLAEFPAYQPRKALPGGKFSGGPASRRDVGRPNRRILGVVVLQGVEYSFHATKGLRSRRVTDGEALFMPAAPVAPAVRYALTVPAKLYLNGPGKRARRLAAKAEGRS